MFFSLNRIIFFIVLILSGCSASVIENNNSVEKVKKPQNTVGYFYIGGFTGNSYAVKISGLSINYSVMRGGKVLKSRNIKLTASELIKFETNLKSLGVMSWSSNYSNPRILDGTNWIAKYKSKNFAINSKGKNNYPKNFKIFKSLISKELLKGLNFQ